MVRRGSLLWQSQGDQSHGPGTRTLAPESHKAHSMLQLPELQVASNVEHHLGKEWLLAKYTAHGGWTN